MLASVAADPYQPCTGTRIAELGRTRQQIQRFAFALISLAHAGEDLALERAQALLHRLALLPEREQIAAARAQLARAHRLDQEIDHTGLERGLAQRLVADHSDQNDRYISVRRRTPEAAREFESVHLRHAVIEQQQIGFAVLGPAQGVDRIAEVLHVYVGTDAFHHVAQHRAR
jgi:hypothetical protein